MCKNKEIMARLPEGASQDEIRAAFFEALRSLNVNDKCEKRDNLTYLSWANAWGEFKKVYPSATYRIINNPTTNMPYFIDPAIGVMVFTEVTANEQTHQMWLPVLNGAQKPMKLEPYEYQVWDRNSRQYINKTVEAVSMFDINKTLMRCLVKNLAMFGLGLYIYAGEDLPENTANSEDHISNIIFVNRIPSEICEELLATDLRGEQFVNPFGIPDEYKAQEAEIRELIQTKAEVEERLSQIKAKILEDMTTKNVKLWATDTMRLTRKLPSTRTAFNLSLFKQDHPDMNYDDYMKESQVSGSLLIAV